MRCARAPGAHHHLRASTRDAHTRRYALHYAPPRRRLVKGYLPAYRYLQASFTTAPFTHLPHLPKLSRTRACPISIQINSTPTRAEAALLPVLVRAFTYYRYRV